MHRSRQAEAPIGNPAPSAARGTRQRRQVTWTRAWAVCGVLLGICGSPQRVAAAPEQPNIIFIMVDDLGKDWISCYGAEGIQTPHIDHLAAHGMRFHNAWSMPQCTPTRVTLLTGQYPWRTGWVNHWDVPRWGVGYFDWRSYTTFASILQSAGYATAIAGKWQINDFRLEPNALAHHGFDEWCVWTGFETGNPPSRERYADPYIHTRRGSQTRPGAFGPDVYCDFLIDFLGRHKDQPALLYFPMALTHGPLVPTPSEPDARQPTDQFRAMVRYTDQLVGRLTRAVHSLGLAQRTILIFTTDNGTTGRLRGTIGGVRPRGGKASKFEGGVCQPLIVHGPGRVPVGETDALTDLSDWLPTFAEWAGASLPPHLMIDGKSLAPLLAGRTTDSARNWILAMGHGPARLDARGVRGQADYADRVLRDKRYKVWLDKAPQITALYDLSEDPLERHNLLTSPASAHRAALARFRAILARQPDRDARPRYTPRQPNAWDRKPTD